jgi:hypothetical protein
VHLSLGESLFQFPQQIPLAANAPPMMRAAAVSMPASTLMQPQKPGSCKQPVPKKNKSSVEPPPVRESKTKPQPGKLQI